MESDEHKLLQIKVTQNFKENALIAPTSDTLGHFHQGMVKQYFQWLLTVEQVHQNVLIQYKAANLLKVLHGADQDLWQLFYNQDKKMYAEAPEVGADYVAKKNLKKTRSRYSESVSMS